MQEDIWAKMNGTLHRIAVLLLFFRANASSWSDGIKSEQKKKQRYETRDTSGPDCFNLLRVRQKC